MMTDQSGKENTSMQMFGENGQVAALEYARPGNLVITILIRKA